MNTQIVRSIVKKFGSQEALAAELKIKQTAVSRWVCTGRIPSWRQAELLELAHRKGVDLRPEDFFRQREDAA